MSYIKLLYHIVFRPKNSIPAIPIEHEEILYRYIWGFIKNKSGILNRIGGMPDHIHLLVQIPPTLSLADFMRDLKTSTHRYMYEQKDKFPIRPLRGRPIPDSSNAAGSLRSHSGYAS